MSWSQPAAIWGSISRTVTSAPAPAKKLANSSPIYPPPMTATFAGISSRSRTPVESSTLSHGSQGSAGTAGSRSGGNQDVFRQVGFPPTRTDFSRRCGHSRGSPPRRFFSEVLRRRGSAWRPLCSCAARPPED